MNFKEFLNEQYLLEAASYLEAINYEEFKKTYDAGEKDDFIKLGNSNHTLIKGEVSNIILLGSSQSASIRTNKLKEFIEFYNDMCELAKKLKVKSEKSFLYGRGSAGLPTFNMNIFGKTNPTTVDLNDDGTYYLHMRNNMSNKSTKSIENIEKYISGYKLIRKNKIGNIDTDEGSKIFREYFDAFEEDDLDTFLKIANSK